MARGAGSGSIAKQSNFSSKAWLGSGLGLGLGLGLGVYLHEGQGARYVHEAAAHCPTETRVLEVGCAVMPGDACGST